VIRPGEQHQSFSLIHVGIIDNTRDPPLAFVRILAVYSRGWPHATHRVPDVKRQKNRLHLDLRTPDLEAEIGRVAGLGATLLTSEPVTEDGWFWHILADPGGNEFCVLQPPGIPSA